MRAIILLHFSKPPLGECDKKEQEKALLFLLFRYLFFLIFHGIIRQHYFPIGKRPYFFLFSRCFCEDDQADPEGETKDEGI